MPTEDQGIDPFALDPIGNKNQPFYKKNSDNISGMGAR